MAGSFSAISFQDGLVSIDKLQKMTDNDDFLYDEVSSKPRGLIGLVERTTNYSQGAGPGLDPLFSDLIVTPVGAGRLMAVYVYIPYYRTGSTTALDSTTLYFTKNGVPVQYGYTDAKHYAGAPHGDHTSFFHGFLDVHPEVKSNIYNFITTTWVIADEVAFDLSASRPAQLWIEDLGAI